ncbi:MAG: shikimate kinase [Kistimonas sp.]|nr:shikimate kinase [Kistimonas sp.]
MQLRTIYLVGPMGAGKTTLGRMLAKELDLPFLDTDTEVEQRCGADIAWIFEREGEEGFRIREEAVLRDVRSLSPRVVATGGGIVTREACRSLIRSHGFVVFLQVGVATQIRRTARDKKRPLLQCADRSRVLAELHHVRDPLYRQVADHIVSTDVTPFRDIIRALVHRLQR